MKQWLLRLILGYEDCSMLHNLMVERKRQSLDQAQAYAAAGMLQDRDYAARRYDQAGRLERVFLAWDPY